MAQCGETIELYVTVGNGGEATLGGLSGKLTESDPYLRLLYNSSASYPALAGGASGENRRDWDLRVSSNTPAGHEFRFTVTYTADTGGPWSIEVTIPISCGTAEPDPPPETTPERVPGVVVFEGFRVDDDPSHDGTETTRGATTMVWRSAARPSSCT